MNKVIKELQVGKYKLLQLDEFVPSKKYRKYVIDGKEYEIVPVYDLNNSIAIESSDNFSEKTVEFV